MSAWLGQADFVRAVQAAAVLMLVAQFALALDALAALTRKRRPTFRRA